MVYNAAVFLVLFLLLFGGCYSPCHPIVQSYSISYNKNVVVTNNSTNIRVSFDDSVSTDQGNTPSGIIDGRPIFNVRAGEYSVQIEFPSVPDVGKSVEYRQHHENSYGWDYSFLVVRNNSIIATETTLNKSGIVTRIAYDIPEDVFPSKSAIDRFAFKVEVFWDDQILTSDIYINEYEKNSHSCS